MSQSWKITVAGPRMLIEAALLAHEDVIEWDPEIVIAGSEVAEDRPDDWLLEAWLPRRPSAADKAAVAGLFGAAKPVIEVEELPDADWLVLSQQGLEPVRAGRFYVHTPDFPPAAEPGLRNFIIPASQAFGTGQHETTAGTIEARRLPGDVRAREDADARRRFVLQVVQPGLVGLMDGSVSTLAPVFAAAFATHSTWSTFLVGLAASIGAGISMGFAEALADDGKLSGRGTPYLRGLVCGLMTMAGGIGHTLPFLVPAFWTATGLSFAVVLLELAVIAWIQWRYMETPPLSAVAKVMLGGALVLAAGILIGSG